MIIENLKLNGENWVYEKEIISDKNSVGIVFIFGDTDIFKDSVYYQTLKNIYPNANIVGCSSAGNILGDSLSYSSMVATAVSFDKIKTILSVVDFLESDIIEDVSVKLTEQLPKEGLQHIFILSDGLNINGSELVRGINKNLRNVAVTGGMAGDGGRFQDTFVIANDIPKQNRVVAIGFYSDSAIISSGCFSGWSEFGAERIITKSSANILFELDGEPALDLYKKYLGEYASELPSSGLRFPLSIKEKDGDEEVIRTLLSINEEDKSITFAGDVPTGFTARLMKPDIELLIEGAQLAAEEIKQKESTGLALIVSCVGRKIILNQFVDEEVEAVGQVLGSNVNLVGFYSYGEFAPFLKDSFHCELHNQTMTLTVIYE